MRRLLDYFGMTGAARVPPSAFVIAVSCAVGAGAVTKAIGLPGLVSSLIVAVVLFAMLWMLAGRHEDARHP